MRLGRRRWVLAVATTLSMLAMGLGGTAGAASGRKPPIVIGYVTSLTGAGASVWADGAGAAQARVALQNAHGGVDGHPLKLVVEDDQSSPQQNLVASQFLVQDKGAFLIVNESTFTAGAAPFLSQAGVPVIGAGTGGPEWTEKQYSNMFATGIPAGAPINGTYYGYTYFGKFLRSIGVTKLAGLAYGISPASQESIVALQDASAAYGVKSCYDNSSVPFGSSDFTAAVLQIKTAGCNVVVGSLVDASDVALSAAVKAAGLGAKQLYFSGYDENVLTDAAARTALDGDYFATPIDFQTPNAAVKEMLKTLKHYDPKYTGGIPDNGAYSSYIGVDLAIKGLELAGSHLTRSVYIARLRNLASYSAEGILPSPDTFRGFGTPAMFPKTACEYFVQLRGARYVSVNAGKPICGTRITVHF